MEFLHNIRENRAFQIGVYSVSAAILAGGLYIANQQGEAMRQGPTIEELLERNLGTQPGTTALNHNVIIEE